jgi:hypothetical protein
MKLRNFTPHTLVVFDDSGKVILSLPSEGQIRVNETIKDIGKIHNVPIVSKQYGKAHLPAYADDEWLVVSKIVLDAMPDTPRLLAPDTSYNSVVKDKNSRILGVRRLQTN